MTLDTKATARTRARYQRIAPIYDKIETLAERRYHPWRQHLWSLAQGPKVLEVDEREVQTYVGRDKSSSG